MKIDPKIFTMLLLLYLQPGHNKHLSEIDTRIQERIQETMLVVLETIAIIETINTNSYVRHLKMWYQDILNNDRDDTTILADLMYKKLANKITTLLSAIQNKASEQNLQKSGQKRKEESRQLRKKQT